MENVERIVYAKDLPPVYSILKTDTLVCRVLSEPIYKNTWIHFQWDDGIDLCIDAIGINQLENLAKTCTSSEIFAGLRYFGNRLAGVYRVINDESR